MNVFLNSFVYSGPAHWCDKFPDAKGQRQSPIDIVTKDAKVDAALGPLKLTPARCADVVNNGKTVQVNIDSSDTSKNYLNKSKKSSPPLLICLKVRNLQSCY